MVLSILGNNMLLLEFSSLQKRRTKGKNEFIKNINDNCFDVVTI